MNGYRPLSSAQRTDHLETLSNLGRLVVAIPSRWPMARSFVVMSLVMFSDGMMAAYAGVDYASDYA